MNYRIQIETCGCVIRLAPDASVIDIPFQCKSHISLTPSTCITTVFEECRRKNYAQYDIEQLVPGISIEWKYDSNRILIISLPASIDNSTKEAINTKIANKYTKVVINYG